MATWQTVRKRRVFVFDVEARPGPWLNADITTKNMLSLAGVYEDDPDNPLYLAPGFKARQLELFCRPFRDGDLIVTHNGFRYDLPFLNGTLVKMGLTPLPKLLVSDTYAHLPKRGRAFSGSLGNMAKRFEVGEEKGSMGEYEWELAYAGNAEALAKLKEYNIGDVITTMALRRKLLDLGYLGPPTTWRP